MALARPPDIFSVGQCDIHRNVFPLLFLPKTRRDFSMLFREESFFCGKIKFILRLIEFNYDLSGNVFTLKIHVVVDVAVWLGNLIFFVENHLLVPIGANLEFLLL